LSLSRQTNLISFFSKKKCFVERNHISVAPFFLKKNLSFFSFFSYHFSHRKLKTATTTAIQLDRTEAAIFVFFNLLPSIPRSGIATCFVFSRKASSARGAFPPSKSPERKRISSRTSPQQSQSSPGANVIKKFPASLMMRPNKLEGLPLATLSCRVLEFDGKARANPIGGPFRCFLLG
jgi:hypothetical protein